MNYFIELFLKLLLGFYAFTSKSSDINIDNLKFCIYRRYLIEHFFTTDKSPVIKLTLYIAFNIFLFYSWICLCIDLVDRTSTIYAIVSYLILCLILVITNIVLIFYLSKNFNPNKYIRYLLNRKDLIIFIKDHYYCLLATSSNKSNNYKLLSRYSSGHKLKYLIKTNNDTIKVKSSDINFFKNVKHCDITKYLSFVYCAFGITSFILIECHGFINWIISIIIQYL